MNPFEPPSAVTFSVLRELVQKLLSELAEGSSEHKSVGLVFSGVCGSGKSFTADQLLVKVFQTVQKTEWLQDLRKYWQVSSVVLKALGCAATQSNKDASRIVSKALCSVLHPFSQTRLCTRTYVRFLSHTCSYVHVFAIGSYGRLSFQRTSDHKSEDQLFFSRPSEFMPRYIPTTHHCMIEWLLNTQSRLVNPSPHEQNYSILYQLLAGLTQDERSTV